MAEGKILGPVKWRDEIEQQQGYWMCHDGFVVRGGKLGGKGGRKQFEVCVIFLSRCSRSALYRVQGQSEQSVNTDSSCSQLLHVSCWPALSIHLISNCLGCNPINSASNDITVIIHFLHSSYSSSYLFIVTNSYIFGEQKTKLKLVQIWKNPFWI